MARAAIEGRVTNPNGTPVWRARVELAGTRVVVFTDTNGRFVVTDAAYPCRLLISHARFEDAEHELTAEPAQALAIILEPKPVLLEEVVVAGTRDGDEYTPATIAASEVRPDDQPAPPSTLTELLKEVPAVAENGQGGVFQVYSVRGVSRERVLTLISGMRVTGERRAGVSASFIDPLLLGSADVLRGPSSTLYGSGAFGGVIQVSPREFSGWSVHTGFESDGGENVQALGWGDRGWSIGLARREAQNSETPDGSEINSHFTQYSATLAKRWDLGSRQVEVMVVPALARDIGKGNIDFPSKVTTYPEEKHLLTRLSMISEGSWRADAFVHPNEFHTRNTTQDGDRTDVINEAFDLGFSLRRPLRVAPRLTGSLGLDYFGRRGVDSRESSNTGDPGLHTLDGGQQDEAALYGSLGWKWGAATLQGGSRATWQRQENGGQPESQSGGPRSPVHGAAWNGFAGALVPMDTNLLLSGEIGTGYRFPNLSERFFTGTTPRGGVIGNPDLDPERSLNVDLGVRWQPERHMLGGHIFRNRVENYIERIEIEPDVLTYENLVSGTITGIEIESFYAPGGDWRLSGSGHLIQGRSKEDVPLDDIPAGRVELGLRRTLNRWRWDLRWQYRDAKDDPGPGEKAISAAQILSASARCEIYPGLSLSLSGSNLLDDEYFNSADEKMPLSPRRSVGIGIAWGERE